jgi:predicted enzyme related to lactoylglutathione lyase
MPEVHVYIEIDDLERGIAFYVDGLGLSVARRLTARWVELAGAQMPIHLLARPEPLFESGEHVLRKDFGRHWTPIHLDFVVDDLDAAVERAVRAGATIERRVDHPGLWRLVALADPFGHGFDLIEDPEPGYARLSGTIRLANPGPSHGDCTGASPMNSGGDPSQDRCNRAEGACEWTRCSGTR